VAGAAWPPVFERAIAAWGWRATMIGFGAVVMAVAIPLAAIFLKPAPDTPEAKPGTAAAGADHGTILGLTPNVLLALLSAAAFLCCVPMAMPASHLIAFCGDLGIAASTGAIMLSVLLVCAFLSRQLWGLISDRIGGLMTLLVGSLAQVTAMLGFLLTQDEAGLFLVAAAFGLGFAGLVPAYMLTVRQLFPAREAAWRIPVVLLTAMAGMAAGSWLAGIIYDHAGAYAPAFAVGIAAHLVLLAIISALVMQRRRVAERQALQV
jgi:predicted MFS family arabinose efflux permease